VYRRPRRRRWRVWALALLALAVLAVAAFGLVALFSSAPDLDKGANLLPTSNPDGIFPWKGGLLCVEGAELFCTDANGDEIWQTALPVENMKAARAGNLTVAWGGKQVMLIDENGVILQRLPTSGDVLLAAPGLTTYAVITVEEGQHRLRFYSVKGDAMADSGDLYPYESVLGLGYYGEKLSQLWVLVVDSNSTLPVTKLITYYPGKKSTGIIITLTDELAYRAFLENNMVYLVSTHTLTYWERTGIKSSSKLIYGWNLEDAYAEDNGRVSFLFSPAGGSASAQISALWYINTTGEEYRIPLPAGCFRAMLKANGRICVATPNGVYSMAKNGSGSRFYPLSTTIDSIPAVIPGKAFVIQERHRNKLISMP
jgi:hypothetical protein